MAPNLTNEQIKELRNSLLSSPLEKSVRTIYSLRDIARPLYGQNSVMLRTLGDNFDINSYSKNYFDEFRNKSAMTEFAEFREALDNYDSSSSSQNKLDLILEAGDLLFQRIVLDVRHRENPKYVLAKNELDNVMLYVGGELRKRGIPFEKVNQLAEIKYGIRSWMGVHNLPSKNKELEAKLCLEVLN